MHFLYFNLLVMSMLTWVSFMGHQVLLSTEQWVEEVTGDDRP